MNRGGKDLLWSGITESKTKSPRIPGHPVSFHNMNAATVVISGAVHKACTVYVTVSNRLTSFDNKFTSLPGAVSFKAVCDKRRDYKTSWSTIQRQAMQNEKFIHDFIYNICDFIFGFMTGLIRDTHLMID